MRTFELLIVGASLALSGCAVLPEPVAPPPVEGAGVPAAAFDVRANRRKVAHVVLWSEGATVDGGTYVHVAASAHNLGESPLRLDVASVVAEPFDADGRPLVASRLRPELRPGAERWEVAAGTARRFDFTFAIPRDLQPSSIAGLRVRWTLVSGDGHEYARSTDFVADEARSTRLVRAFTPIIEPHDVRQVMMPGRGRPRRE